MKITYLVIVSIVTYIFGAINKAFIKVMPDKYIPIQNVFIGIVSGLICYYSGITTNIYEAMVLCLLSTMGAGGMYDLANIKKGK